MAMLEWAKKFYFIFDFIVKTTNKTRYILLEKKNDLRD